VTKRQTIEAGTVFVVAAAIRVVYWFVTPPVHASDSAGYLETAKAVSVGQWDGLVRFPFHAAYALLLAPAFWHGEHVRPYVAVLHIALSSASVVWVWAITRQLTNDSQAPILAVACAALYPNLLFWMPYILTETPFVFVLLGSVWALLNFLADVSGRRAALVILVGGCLFFLRPVALLLVACGAVVIASAWARRFAPQSARRVTMWACVAVGAVAVLPWSIPSSRAALVRIPTISQTLWLSTLVVHGTQREITRAATPVGVRDWPDSEQYAFKAQAAGTFIRDHPIRYLVMGGRRFVSFWTPWWYLDWSRRHRAIDAIVSLSLIVAACCAPFFGVKRSAWALLMAFAFLLACESAFGQIDADGRYRLPAEVLLIAPAAVTVSGLLHSLRRLKSSGVRASV
jgi:hypothetical protein